MTRRTAWIAAAASAAVVASIAAGQYYRGRHGYDPRRGVPEWELDREMPEDVFTFVRIRYGSDFRNIRRGRGGWGRRRGYGWDTDYPDADLNFSYRLQQLTSLKVDPDGVILELTDPELFDYPFIYLVEPGGLALTEEEVVALRRYLLGGGFMMVDDFWGGAEWDNFYREIKRVFPNREPDELSIDHPIFHTVYDLDEKPQVPSIQNAWRGYDARRDEDDDGSQVHYRALFDDHGQMMAIICHNTDLGDGWEREGENREYFKIYSEPRAYPMGINIVFYAMTH